MSDAAMKVDPDYYNRRLLGSDEDTTSSGGNHARIRNNVHGGMEQSRSMEMEGRLGQRASGMRCMRDDRPDLPDYLLRQHSLLGLYLSLNPGDEADAEANWGFSLNKRIAIAGVSVVVPLFLSLMTTGSWFWKVCVIGAITVAAMLAMRFALSTIPDLETTVQGYTLAVWPHGTVGCLGLMGVIWLIVAAVSGTGWSTLWLSFTCILFLVSAEAILRGGMWHFRWWAPAERFVFLKPWGEDRISSSRTANQSQRASGYSPPRPTSAPPAQQPVQSEPSLGPGGGGRMGSSFSQRVELNRNLNGNMDSDDIFGELGNVNSGFVEAAAEEEAAAELLKELEGRHGSGGMGGGRGGGGKMFDDEDLQESV